MPWEMTAEGKWAKSPSKSGSKQGSPAAPSAKGGEPIDMDKVKPGDRVIFTPTLGPPWKYEVKGSDNKSAYPCWLEHGMNLWIKACNDEYWVQCESVNSAAGELGAASVPYNSWFVPKQDLSMPSADNANAAPSLGVSYPLEASSIDIVMEQLEQLAAQSAKDMHESKPPASCSSLEAVATHLNVVATWQDKVRALQAQVIGWEADVRERMEEAEREVDKAEDEVWAREVDMKFFAESGDY